MAVHGNDRRPPSLWRCSCRQSPHRHRHCHCHCHSHACLLYGVQAVLDTHHASITICHTPIQPQPCRPHIHPGPCRPPPSPWPRTIPPLICPCESSSRPCHPPAMTAPSRHWHWHACPAQRLVLRGAVSRSDPNVTTIMTSTCNLSARNTPRAHDTARSTAFEIGRHNTYVIAGLQGG